MFEGIDFSKMGQMLEDVQKKAQEIEQESQRREFGAKSGGGLVSVKANGKGEVLDISIDDSLLEDKESLQILLISAVKTPRQGCWAGLPVWGWTDEVRSFLASFGRGFRGCAVKFERPDRLLRFGFARFCFLGQI